MDCDISCLGLSGYPASSFISTFQMQTQHDGKCSLFFDFTVLRSPAGRVGTSPTRTPPAEAPFAKNLLVGEGPAWLYTDSAKFHK